MTISGCCMRWAPFWLVNVVLTRLLIGQCGPDKASFWSGCGEGSASSHSQGDPTQECGRLRTSGTGHDTLFSLEKCFWSISSKEAAAVNGFYMSCNWLTLNWSASVQSSFAILLENMNSYNFFRYHQIRLGEVWCQIFKKKLICVSVF